MLDACGAHDAIVDDEANLADYRFIEINPAFEKTSGLKGEFIGRTLREVVSDLEPDGFRLSPTEGRIGVVFLDLTPLKTPSTPNEDTTAQLKQMLSSTIDMLGTTIEVRAP